MARIRDAIMKVNERNISHAIGFPIEGGEWFKNRPLDCRQFSCFLPNKNEEIDWEIRVSLTHLEQKWHNLLLEQGPEATEEAASLADRQFWQIDKIELRRRSRFPAAEQSRKP